MIAIIWYIDITKALSLSFLLSSWHSSINMTILDHHPLREGNGHESATLYTLKVLFTSIQMSHISQLSLFSSSQHRIIIQYLGQQTLCSKLDSYKYVQYHGWFLFPIECNLDCNINWKQKFFCKVCSSTWLKQTFNWEVDVSEQVFRKSITHHRAIRHFDFYMSNEVSR